MTDEFANRLYRRHVRVHDIYMQIRVKKKLIHKAELKKTGYLKIQIFMERNDKQAVRAISILSYIWQTQVLLFECSDSPAILLLGILIDVRLILRAISVGFDEQSCHLYLIVSG